MKVNFDKTFKDCFGNEVVNDKTGKATNIAESLCMVIFNLNSMGGRTAATRQEVRVA